MDDRNKKQEWRRAMFLADLGLILALLIVLYALSKHWVEPKQTEELPAAAWTGLWEWDGESGTGYTMF